LKQQIKVLLMASMLMVMSSCSGSGSGVGGGTGPGGGPQGITAGNWVVIGTSQLQYASSEALGGSLSVSGNDVSMLATAAGTCFYLPTALSGSMNGNSITLTSASVQGKTIEVMGTVYNGSNIGGTYQITGGPARCNGDTGTVYGTLIPSLSGNWSGNLQEVPAVPPNDLSTLNTVTLGLSVTQATSPSTNGSFALSGSVTPSATLGVPPECNPSNPKPPAYCSVPPPPGSNSPCFATGTIDPTQSSVQGDVVTMVVDADSGATVNITAQLINPNQAVTMSIINYQVSGGLCDGYSANGTPKLNKS
jgi:hypothetical protein